MYAMTNSINLFSGDLTHWLIDEPGFKPPQYQMAISYNYAIDESNYLMLMTVYIGIILSN